MKTLGLTLGKFAPLHKGHQLMIETALQEVDELIVVIYETSVSPVPLHIRANWIRRLYPSSVRVIEAWMVRTGTPMTVSMRSGKNSIFSGC